MKTLLIVIAVAAALLVVFATISGGQATPANQVTLRAAAGASAVQMFDRAGAESRVIRQFATGQTCTKFGGPTTVTIEGISMTFYRLTCNNTTGYINTKWVR